MTTMKFPVLTSFCFAAIAIAASMGTAAQKQVPTGPVLRLLIPAPEGCVGDKAIPVEVALRNGDSASVTIPVGALGSHIHYSAYSPPDIHSPGYRTLDVDSELWPGREQPQREVTLRPGESYWINGTLTLDQDFFSNSGMYDVSIELPTSWIAAGTLVRRLESNRVFFELEDCKLRKSK